MPGDDDDQYNDSNRAFLQAFIARSVLTYEHSKPILAAIFTAHGRPSNICCCAGPEIAR